MSKLSGLSNGFSSDSDSSEGSGWQQQKRDRRRRPFRGSGARIFYNHQRGSKNTANNGDLSESAESDNDSDYASPDRRNGTNARGRGISGANRGLNSARRPFVKKFRGRGRAYVNDYDQERNVGSRYSDRDRYTEDRKPGQPERSSDAIVKKHEDDADERPKAASDSSMRYSRNRRIVTPAKPAEEIPKPKLPPVHHRNLPPRLQRKFGLINDAQDTSKAASTEVITPAAAAQNAVEKPQTATPQAELTPVSSTVTVPPDQAHNNVAHEEKVKKTENAIDVNNAAVADDEEAMLTRTNYWRARHNAPQPITEQDEKKMLTVAMEESRKEIERKKQLQLRRQKEMEQIKQICMQGFPSLTPDIRNDIFRAVQSQIHGQVKAPPENSKPVEETLYHPSNNAPIGTKPPAQPIKAPSDVFNQLSRFGRSPHICVSVDDSGEIADKTNAEVVNVKLKVYPPPPGEDDVFHTEHSTSFFTAQNTNELEMQGEQGTHVPFGPPRQNVKSSPAAEVSSFGIRNLFIGQPSGSEFMMQTGNMMSTSNPNISQFCGDDVFDVFRPKGSVLPYVSQPKSEPASRLTQSPIKPPPVTSGYGMSSTNGMTADFANPYSRANLFNNMQIGELPTAFTGDVPPVIRRTSNPDCIPDGIRAFTDPSLLRWGMPQPKPETTVDGIISQQDPEPVMSGLRTNPHPDRRDQTEWIMSLFKANFGNPADRSNGRKMNDIPPVTSFSEAGTREMQTAERNNSAGSSGHGSDGTGILVQNSPPVSSHENNVTVTDHKDADLNLSKKSDSDSSTGKTGKNEMKADEPQDSNNVKVNTAGGKLALAVDAVPFVPQNLSVAVVATDEKDNENIASTTLAEAEIPKSPPKLETVAEAVHGSVTLTPTNIPESGNFMECTPSIPNMNMMPQFMPGYPTPWPMSMQMTPMGPMPYYPQWPYYPPMPMMMPMPMPMMPMPYWQTPRAWPRMPPGMVHPMMQQHFSKQASLPVSVPGVVPPAVAADGEAGIQNEETKE